MPLPYAENLEKMSLLDGHLTIEEIIDSAAMPEEIVQAAIRRLVELKLVKL